MEITGVNRYDTTTTRRMIENGAFKVADYLKACLDRIAEREGDVGAFTYIAAEYALAQAAVADAQPPSGPLHGIPVAIKDIIDTHDMPTEHGSPIYSGSIPGVRCRLRSNAPAGRRDHPRQDRHTRICRGNPWAFRQSA
jgi:Asp-tRNA(Asn)/Glu-tRNA(Gln) amidotransferase A subunit family amidase